MRNASPSSDRMAETRLLRIRRDTGAKISNRMIVKVIMQLSEAGVVLRKRVTRKGGIWRGA
jgi:hypothetical protein